MSHQPPHESRPLEGTTPDDFSLFEARLAGLIPATSRVDRDEIMFQAGRTVSQRAHRRTMRRWQAACGLLLCVTVGQWAILPRLSELPPHQQLAQLTESVQDEKPAAAQLPQEETSRAAGTIETSQEPAVDEADQSPSQKPPTPELAQPESPVPSIWGIDFWMGRPGRRLELRQDLGGRGLTVGSPPSAVWNEPATPPRASRSPAPSPRTARELMTEWLKQPNFP